MEELSVGTGSDFIDNSRLEVKEDGSWDVLASSSLAEEGVEGIVSSSDGLIGRHLAIRLDTMLEAEEFPTGVTNLDSGLTDVN